MKSAVALWGGALSVTVVAPTIFFWLAARPPAVNPEALVPVATPPGITLQVHASEAHGRSAAVSEVVYADALGMTLYTYDKEVQNGKLACAGECAGVWQPALAPPTAVQAGPWSLIKREDGTKQWTFRGAPLYRFRQERAIGEAAGDNAEAGAWHAAAFRPEAGMILPEEITVRDIVNAGGAGLVDYMGRTIYAFDGDPLRPMPQWLPLEAPEIANPTGEFSVIARDDGITQWAYRGKALYSFDGDQKPGDANGAGSDSRFRVALIVRYFMPDDATIRANAELGDLLTTSNGVTLYERDRVIPGEGHGFRTDHGSPALGRLFGTSTCDATCAITWPPFAAPANALPSGYWEVARRQDGTRQWAYKGFALYTYKPDRPGETSGNEIYDLAQIGDKPIIPTSRDDPDLAVGGTVAGVGVGGMLWHPVVP